MTRGYSLEQDLRLLINNPKYSDIEILCKDERKFYVCRAILAARSEVFDALLYNGMRESYEKQISFSSINSSGMEIILEYIYTGVISKKSLTKDNIIEAFIAADYFQLPELQGFILETVRNTLKTNYEDNYSPELLSKIVNTMPITEDNILFNLLVEKVSTIPLNTIEFGRLSTAALQFLLTYSYEKEIPFATSEYDVFRYSTILVASQISADATETLLKHMPASKQIDDSKRIENGHIPDYQKLAKELEPLIKFIDFRRIKGKILAEIIEPLNIIPAELIINAYRHKAISNNTDINEIRGISNYVWDKSACGSRLIINDDGNVVQCLDAGSHQSVRAKAVLENKGIFEWDVIIEKYCGYSWIGVCASEDFDYERFAGVQRTAWILGSTGSTFHFDSSKKGYCPSFEKDNSKITVHLDMFKRTCAFSVNGIKYPVVSEWENLPSKLYPVVSLKYPGQFRIQLST